ncbi:MAG: sugar phosphate isomerase/epimerase [Bryobacterales bacterium]|nr:sugar phosphate isomerase/epimerase [Bryobacterales bacterium]
MNRRTLLQLPLAAAGRAAGATPWMLGANTAIDGYGLLEAIQKIRELGFQAIEIHTMGDPEPRAGRFPGFQFDRIPARQRDEIKSALAGFARVTAHLPYTGLNYMASAEAVRTVEIAMEGTAFFGAKLAVLHPQPLPDSELETRWAEYLKRFRTWGDRALGLGLRLALETGYPRSVRGFVRLIREIAHEAVGATIDVGHQSRYEELTARVKPEDKAAPAGIRAYNDTTMAIVEQLGSKVFHFHVHDIDPRTWQEHKPLVHGFVDYPRLAAALRMSGYTGLWMLEIGGAAENLPSYLSDAKAKLAAI